MKRFAATIVLGLRGPAREARTVVVARAGARAVSSYWLSRCVAQPVLTLAFPCSLDAHEISKEADVQGEARGARHRGRPHNRIVSAKPCIHRRREQPQLQYDSHQDEDQHAVNDRESLFAAERSGWLATPRA